jgi:hypothetical protein
MRRTLSLLLLAPMLAGAASVPAGAQRAVLTSDTLRDDRFFSFYDRGPYRPQVPRPDSLLGYGVGETHTQYAWQERVLLAIANAARDRVRVQEIGTTTERRTQRLFLISSPDNITRLDAIQADLQRLGDPRGLSPSDAATIAARVPAVVWINESVHGSEAAGFEAAMQTLYQLAASEEPATVNALRNVLVVLNPSTNPDGHERFSVWYNSISVRSPEAFALEYAQPWSITGRYNHYRFDMNRDVMTTTQREARNLLTAAMRWNPMVTIDQHGYTYSFFFPPTAKPMNVNVGPDFQKWMEIFGRANAAAFDRYGWMYYSRDVFDFYGPFYWDMWPSLTGAIGMTYETDCYFGIVTRREDGTLCTFRGGVAKHFVSAMATIEATSARKAERLADWMKFRREAVDEGRSAAMKRVVLVPSRDPGTAAELVATLLRSGIEVRRAIEPFSAARAHAYRDDAVASRRFDAGAYVIDLAQPLGRAARAVLEPSPALDTAFARSQIERYRRNLRRGANVPGEGYEFYDVTAWSLPVVFGVEAYWTEDLAPVNGPLVRAADLDVPGGISGARPARSAYVFTSERNDAPVLALRLLTSGVRVGLSNRPIEAGGRDYPRGTYIVRVGRNDTTVHSTVERLAREAGVQVVGINTAFSERAQFGVGSESVYDLRVPNVALVGEEGVSVPGYGAAWYVLEQRYGIPFTPVPVRWLAGGDLSRFNVIIVPDGSAGTLNRILGTDGATRLRDWVRAGGTLVTFGGASSWAARDNVNLTTARVVGADAKPDSAAGTRPDTSAAARRRAEDDLLAATSPSMTPDRPASLPGSHFDAVLDRTHWLTSGYEDQRLTALMEGSTFLTLSKEGANVAVFPSTGRLHRAGFIWPENTERLLRSSALVIEEPTGSGHVVLFANDPWFRAWWHALDRLVLNAIVLGPSF